MDDLDRRFTEAETECEMRINEFADTLNKRVLLLEERLSFLEKLLLSFNEQNKATSDGMLQELTARACITCQKLECTGCVAFEEEVGC